jgi:hypothetical protein
MTGLCPEITRSNCLKHAPRAVAGLLLPFPSAQTPPLSACCFPSGRLMNVISAVRFMPQAGKAVICVIY